MVNRSASEWERFYGKKYDRRAAAAWGRHWGRGNLRVGDVCQLRSSHWLDKHKIVKVKGVFTCEDGFIFINVAFLGPNVVSRTPSPVDEDGFATVGMCGVFPVNLRLIP